MKIAKFTKVFRVDPDRPQRRMIEAAAKALKEGRLVAFPTETVYGLGANLAHAGAMRKLREVKRRPKGKPFAILVADTAAVNKMGCRMTKGAAALARRFWPGPLTMVLRSKAGGKKAFRVPDHKVALALLKKAAVPVAAPSANISGRKPPTDARGVLKDLDGKIDILLDSGPAAVGVESTVIDMSSQPPKILRQGAISPRKIKRILKDA